MRYPLFSVLPLVLLAGCQADRPTAPASAASAAAPRSTPAAQSQPATGVPLAMQTATFGAGCFWGVEETFRVLPGVKDTAVGYMGGTTERPTYHDVCTDQTGHAEVVQVQYDPAVISYDQLLDVFWKNHDPTQLNRQGPDYGSQYRSVVFYHDEAQRQAAEASKQRLAASGRFRRPVVTQIVPAATFWRAEDYHQKYLLKQGRSSCHVN